MRHIRSEYSIGENVLPLAARSTTFQSVGLSLQWLLPSRAIVRLNQHCKVKKNYLTQFIEQTRSCKVNIVNIQGDIAPSKVTLTKHHQPPALH